MDVVDEVCRQWGGTLKYSRSYSRSYSTSYLAIDFDRIASGGAMNGWFSKHKWTKRMQNGGFPFVYYWKSEHSSIFKAQVSEHDAKCRIFAGLLLEKWSLVDFQSMRERTWCKMGDFRGFTIVKVSIGRFSKLKWTKMMQNGGFSRFYYWKSDHWSIFKAWVNENGGFSRIYYSKSDHLSIFKA